METKVKLGEILSTTIKAYSTTADKVGVEMPLLDYYYNDTFNIRKFDVIGFLRKQTDDKAQNYIKSTYLPAATISCICDSDKSDIKVRNNLIVIDIDEHDNEILSDDDERFKMKAKILQKEYVAMVGNSCRGKGLFVIIPIMFNDDDNFKKHFYSLEDDFKKDFGLIIDAACKNINRLRFITQDDMMLVRTKKCRLFDNTYEELANNQSEIMVYDKIKEPEMLFATTDIKFTPSFKEEELNTQRNKNTFVYNDNFCWTLLLHLFDDCAYQVADYNEWWKDACRLSTLGNMGEDLFLILSRNSQKYEGDDDVLLRYHQACNAHHNFNRYDSMVYYFGKAKSAYGNEWFKFGLK